MESVIRRKITVRISTKESKKPFVKDLWLRANKSVEFMRKNRDEELKAFGWLMGRGSDVKHKGSLHSLLEG